MHYRSWVIGVLFFMVNALAQAHETSSSEHHSQGGESGITGAIEFRPSWDAASGDVFGENTVEIGYRFGDRFQLGYQQEIHHNISLNEPNPEHEGLGLHLETGLLRAHIHEIWETSDGRSSLSLEPRIHLPTSSEEREKGFVTAGLCYVKFRHELGSTASLTVMDAPTVFFYSVPGATVGEEFEANPTFQNRFQLAFDIALADQKLNMSFPILFYLTRHADFEPEAEHNNSWTSFLGIAPEINYAFTPNFSAGVALVTPNLLDSQMADHSVNHGRTSSVGQFVVRASL